MHQKDIIKWTYAHSGIKWTDSEKLKFTDLAKGILNSDISKWRKSSQRKGESYANFAEALLTEFVYQESGGIQDKLIYIKEGCKYINYITK